MPERAARSFRAADEDFPVWPEHWPVVRLFVGLQTQWRVGMGGVIGLDYNALPVVARALRIRITPQRFDDLRVMEAEALRSMRKK